jgi:hypothetical protein
LCPRAVFKIFVANPKKSKAVTEILTRNKRKLIEFLSKFQKEKGECPGPFACTALREVSPRL